MTTATDRTWEVIPAPSSLRIQTSIEGSKSTCSACHLTITLLGGSWTDPDGCTACYMDLSAPYVPHKPSTEGDQPPMHLPKPTDPWAFIPNAGGEDDQPW